MKLPEREYYPLSLAARHIGCNEDDLLHYLATGELDFYVFINEFHAPDGKFFHLSIPAAAMDAFHMPDSILGDEWDIHGISIGNKTSGFPLDGHYAKSIQGFFQVDAADARAFEFAFESVEITSLVAFNSDNLNYPYYLTLLDFELKLTKELICIKRKDLDSFVSKNKNFKNSDVILNNQSSLIKALLYIHYGSDVADNPRTFFDSLNSEIKRDFDIKGIELPSGKTIANWLKGVDIKFK